MNRRNTSGLSAGLLLVVCLGGCTEDADAEGCSTDEQCKGDRICYEGSCVAPADVAVTAGGSNGEGGEDGSEGEGEDDDGGSSTSGSDLPALACGYTDLAATAELNEGFTEGVPESLELTFASNGGLVELGEVGCEPSTAPADFEPGTSYECFETYLCGSCQVIIGKQPVETDLFWFVVPVQLRVPECTAVDGYYRWQEGAGGDTPDTTSGGTNTCEPGCVGGEFCNDGTCECRDECVNPFGSSCCGGPFCGGDCAISPCCS